MLCKTLRKMSIPIPIPIPGGQEGVLLFCEDAPILDLALDPCDNFESLWVATTNTWVNK